MEFTELLPMWSERERLQRIKMKLQTLLAFERLLNEGPPVSTESPEASTVGSAAESH